MSDQGRHTPNLAIFAFCNLQFQPGSRNRRPVTDWRIARPDLRFWDPRNPARRGYEIPKIDPARQLINRSITRQTLDLGPIHLDQLVPGMGDSRLQDAIVGQHDKAFRVGIEPARRIDIRKRHVILQRHSTADRPKLGQYPVGLVEQDDLAQAAAGVLPPKAWQKRKDSG